MYSSLYLGILTSVVSINLLNKQKGFKPEFFNKVKLKQTACRNWRSIVFSGNLPSGEVGENRSTVESAVGRPYDLRAWIR